MTIPHRRLDIADSVWELLDPHWPGDPGKKGPASHRQPVVPERGVLEPEYRGPLIGYGASTGGNCRRTWKTGKILIVASAAGGTAGYGKTFWIRSLMNRTSSAVVPVVDD